MTDLIVVSTCPRPGGVSYLPSTLQALDAAGAADHEYKLVVSDGPINIVVPGFKVEKHGWRVKQYGGPSGSRRATWRILELADLMVDLLEVDRVLLLQDDGIPCRNAIKRALATRVPAGCGFVTFFDLFEFPRAGAAPHGLHQIPMLGRRGIGGIHGGLARLFPAEVVRYLAGSWPHGVGTRNKPEHDVDLVVCELLAKSSWPNAAVHLPCLFDHGGQVSTCRTPSGLKASQFPGVDFDALTLPPY